MTETIPALSAATVIVGRDAPGGLEVLFLRRSNVGAFAGMWVFPGGRVDDDDGADGDTEEERARWAAVREATEEAQLTLDPVSLAPFAHWTPPLDSPRKRFATWFFVAPWAGDAVTVDGHEIVDHRWVRPADALAEALPMAPPTFVTLHQLAAFASWAALVTGLATWPVERFLTRNGRQADGANVLMWAGDAGYESGDADELGARHRVLWAGEQPLDYQRHG